MIRVHGRQRPFSHTNAADIHSDPPYPRLNAPLTPDRRSPEPADIGQLALIENVLLKLLPVCVALGQHLA
jgi:hypothetical protein